MTITKSRTAVISAILLASFVTTLVIQHQARARFTQQEALLRQQADRLERLAEENERLSNLAAQANGSAANNQLNELLKLRSEAESLRPQTKELALLREENHRRQTPLPSLQEAKGILQWKEALARREESLGAWAGAFSRYADENQGQFPGSFEQAEHFLPEVFKGNTSVTPNQLEILYKGSRDSLTNLDVILFRENELFRNIDGRWARHYGLANGQLAFCGSKDGNYDEWESQNTAPPSAR